MINSTHRLAQAILDFYPQRFMLSSAEIGTLNQLERYAAPVDKFLVWIEEFASQAKRPSLGVLIQHLERRAQRWQMQHIGEQYHAESTITAEQLQTSFAQLIQASQTAAASVSFEHGDQRLVKLLEWLSARLQQCAEICMSRADVDPIDQLHLLEEALCDRVLMEAPPDLLNRVQAKTKELMSAEFTRCRPQDLVVAQRKIQWKLLREELQLPPLYLNLYGTW